MKTTRVGLAAAALAAFVSCGGGEAPTPDNGPVGAAPGDPCSGEAPIRCAASSGSLLCEAGKYVAGPACPGCVAYGSNNIACSNGPTNHVVAVEGSACPAADGSHACTADGKQFVRCTEGKWSNPCKPSFVLPGSCFDIDFSASDVFDHLQCLTAGAALCDVEGLYACGADEQAYQCSGGVYQPVFKCPAPQECGNITSKDQFSCGAGSTEFSVTYAREGDPCVAEGSAACTFDQGTVLVCEKGKWIVYQVCSSSSLQCQRDLQQGTIGCK